MPNPPRNRPLTPYELGARHEASHPGHYVVGDGIAYACLTCPDSWGEGEVELCRATKMVGPTEMICTALAHDDPRGSPPRSERHCFARRWPYRP